MYNSPFNWIRFAHRRSALIFRSFLLVLVGDTSYCVLYEYMYIMYMLHSIKIHMMSAFYPFASFWILWNASRARFKWKNNMRASGKNGVKNVCIIIIGMYITAYSKVTGARIHFDTIVWNQLFSRRKMFNVFLLLMLLLCILFISLSLRYSLMFMRDAKQLAKKEYGWLVKLNSIFHKRCNV